MLRASTLSAWMIWGASFAGCSLALSYPPSVVEQGPMLCHDTMDQDVDGLIDCADPECTPWCPEVCDNTIDDDLDGKTNCVDPECDGSPACPEEDSLCSDGRDNDLDGRIDARDAACWPGASTTIQRCATVLHTSIELAASDFLGGTLVDDPFGTGEGPWVRVPRGNSGLTHSGLTTGALEQTHLTVVFHLFRPLPPGGAPLVLPLALAQLGVPSTTRTPTRAISVALGGGNVVIADGTSVLARTDMPRYAQDHVRAQLDVSVSGGTVSASVRIDDDAPIEASAPLAQDWPEAPGLQLTLGAEETVAGSITYVERATLERATLTRCGAAEPPLAIVDDGLAEHANAALIALTRGPGASLCGIVAAVERAGQIRELSVVSDDDGATFARGETLYGPRFVVVGPAPATAAPAIRVAYDPVTST